MTSHDDCAALDFKFKLMQLALNRNPVHQAQLFCKYSFGGRRTIMSSTWLRHNHVYVSAAPPETRWGRRSSSTP